MTFILLVEVIVVEVNPRGGEVDEGLPAGVVVDLVERLEGQDEVDVAGLSRVRGAIPAKDRVVAFPA